MFNRWRAKDEFLMERSARRSVSVTLDFSNFPPYIQPHVWFKLFQLPPAARVLDGWLQGDAPANVVFELACESFGTKVPILFEPFDLSKGGYLPVSDDHLRKRLTPNTGFYGKFDGEFPPVGGMTLFVEYVDPEYRVP